MRRLTKADLEDKLREMRNRHQAELQQIREELPAKQSDIAELKYSIESVSDRLTTLEDYVYNFIIEKDDE